jgi:hypothetical protein
LRIFRKLEWIARTLHKVARRAAGTDDAVATEPGCIRFRWIRHDDAAVPADAETPREIFAMASLERPAPLLGEIQRLREIAYIPMWRVRQPNVEPR